jgi:hypothetical protein
LKSETFVELGVSRVVDEAGNGVEVAAREATDDTDQEPDDAAQRLQIVRMLHHRMFGNCLKLFMYSCVSDPDTKLHLIDFLEEI